MSDVSHLERDLRAVQASCDLDAQNRGQNPYLFTGVADARRNYALAQAHGVVSFPSIVLFTRGPGKSLVLESELVQGSVDGLSAPYLIELVNRKVGSVAQIWKVETIVTALQINTYDIFVENPTSATVAVLCCGGSVSESAVTDGLARLAARRNLETLRLAVASDPLLCERFQITPGVAAAIYYGFGSAKRPVLVASTEHAASADALVHDLEVFLDDVNSASKANPGIDDANTAHLDVGKIDDACDVE
ncbi:Hypothetical Protein FCC1311_044292 [Hondaea fermentalgiana]|uniref:Thioredoxin domain-containing protein n=1 Tax=Hondaea fermentalgiana TaxID=2315210 RepID=A0A2R5GB16_9STRA|nr:Hypothetical Protein FCC1311_044292 [Hondaea fermentalgiana]|eukprot:GBG28206.1 Hypothetical Protein FCC1311_044292 [Hondaea fermentalgiana]